MALNYYLFCPGGWRDGIPTKTPCCQIQLSGRLSSSLRTPLHVWSTIPCVRALLSCSFLFVDRMSKCKQRFSCATHLLWISSGEWNLSGSPSNLMTFSHHNFHIKCVDSVTRISKRQFLPWSFLPFSFLKSASAQPRTVPNHISGQDSLHLNHRFFAKFQMILMAFELGHSMTMCSIDLDSPHNMHLS